MIRRLLTLAATAALLATTVVAGTNAPSFTSIATNYETIRKSLAADQMTGIAENAKAIESASKAMTSSFDAKSAGFDAAKASTAKAILPAVSAAAGKLAAAKNLAEARAAFNVLSEKMIKLRTFAVGAKPIVAYCSMEKKSWLQASTQIGNPYLGAKMASCGEVIER